MSPCALSAATGDIINISRPKFSWHTSPPFVFFLPKKAISYQYNKRGEMDMKKSVFDVFRGHSDTVLSAILHIFFRSFFSCLLRGGGCGRIHIPEIVQLPEPLCSPPELPGRDHNIELPAGFWWFILQDGQGSGRRQHSFVRIEKLSRPLPEASGIQDQAAPPGREQTVPQRRVFQDRSGPGGFFLEFIRVSKLSRLFPAPPELPAVYWTGRGGPVPEGLHIQCWKRS